MAKSAKSPTTVTDRFVRVIVGRLAEAKRVRRVLPHNGRLHIDRPLPFLCVYRRPVRGLDVGTERLVTTEPSYLIFSAAKRLHGELTTLVQGIAELMVEQFGAFLLLEISAGDTPNASGDEPGASPQPRLRIISPKREPVSDLLNGFRSYLAQIRIGGRRVKVSVTHKPGRTASRLSPIITWDPEMAAANYTVVRLEVAPIYRNPDTGELYPLVLREVRRELSRAMRRMFYDFARNRTTHRPRHFHVLGRKAVVKAVWKVDAGLAAVADQFDFLLQVTPVNATAAWQTFSTKGYSRKPLFLYRPLEIDPVILKRQLYRIPLERIEDPAIALIFREKQDELDRQLTLLTDLNSTRFVHGSIPLFGDVSGALLRTAQEILGRVPPRARDDSRGGHLEATEFAAKAQQEIDQYRDHWQEVAATVQVRHDVPSGLMVSRGSLLIGAGTRVPHARAEALIQHEIGTHVLTYYNGRAQPFRQLYSGLAGYEALQEGLAVLAEYLVGGLSRPRLRLLAARVVAVREMIKGASFVETFGQLVNQYRFDRRTAFMITMRVYRGGGLTKDAVYLKGLLEVLSYIASGGELNPLYVGKIATEHITIMRELTWRGVLRDPPLVPRYLDREDVLRRLDRVRKGAGVLDLLEEVRR